MRWRRSIEGGGQEEEEVNRRRSRGGRGQEEEKEPKRSGRRMEADEIRIITTSFLFYLVVAYVCNVCVLHLRLCKTSNGEITVICY